MAEGCGTTRRPDAAGQRMSGPSQWRHPGWRAEPTVRTPTLGRGPGGLGRRPWGLCHRSARPRPRDDPRATHRSIVVHAAGANTGLSAHPRATDDGAWPPSGTRLDVRGMVSKPHAERRATAERRSSGGAAGPGGRARHRRGPRLWHRARARRGAVRCGLAAPQTRIQVAVCSEAQTQSEETEILTHILEATPASLRKAPRG